MAASENVLPFQRVRWQDIPGFHSAHMVTSMVVLYPTDDVQQDCPDMRTSNTSLSVRKMLQLMELGYTPCDKAPDTVIERATSYFVMAQLSAGVWAAIVVVLTPIRTALKASSNLAGLLTTKARPASYVPPECLQTSGSILDDIRHAVNEIRSPVIPNASAVFVGAAIPTTRNLTVTDVGMLQAVNNSSFTAPQILTLCDGTSWLSPFVAFSPGASAAVLHAIAAAAPEMAASAHALADWLQMPGPSVPALQGGGGAVVFEMTMRDICALLNGCATAPICVSDAYIRRAMVSAGGVVDELVGFTRAQLLVAMIRNTDVGCGAGGSAVAARFLAPQQGKGSAAALRFPPWMYKMEFMRGFKTDVQGSWAAFGTAFAGVYRRICNATPESPPWIVTTFRGLVRRGALALDSSNSGDLLGRSANKWWILAGDVSGACSAFTLIEQMMTGAFAWSGKTPITICYNFYSEAGQGKTFAQDFFAKIPGLIQTQKWLDGTDKSWYINPEDYDPIYEHTVVLFDDTAIGLRLSPGQPICMEKLSIWKEITGTKMQVTENAVRRFKKSKVDTATLSSITSQIVFPIPGLILTSNSTVFTGQSPAEQAVSSRLIYKQAVHYRQRVLSVTPTAGDKTSAIDNILTEHNWVKAVGLIHAALGIMLQSPVAFQIFDDVTRLVLAGSHGHINMGMHGRFAEKFKRYVDWYAIMDFVTRLMATGIGPAGGGELGPEEIGRILADSCFTVPTPVHCMQAAMLVVAGLPTPLSALPTPAYQLLDMLAPVSLLVHGDAMLYARPGALDPLSKFLDRVDDAGVVAIPTGFSISRSWLAAAASAPQAIPNVLDAAIAGLIAAGGGVRTLRIAAVLDAVLPAARGNAAALICLYHNIMPDQFQVPIAAVQEIFAALQSTRILLANLLVSPHVITLVGYEGKFDAPPPAVVPMLHWLSRKYNVRRPFFVATAEAMQSTATATALPGLFRYTPPQDVAMVDVSFLVTPLGKATVTCVATPAMWERELAGSPNSITAMLHRNRYPFLGEHVPVVLTASALNDQCLAPYVALRAVDAAMGAPAAHTAEAIADMFD